MLRAGSIYCVTLRAQCRRLWLVRFAPRDTVHYPTAASSTRRSGSAYSKRPGNATLDGQPMTTRRSFTRALLLAALPSPLFAQSSVQKKTLTQADWDRWRSIQTPTLSNDGKWSAYTLSPQVGDGEFVVRSTTGTSEYRIPVGFIGRPNNTPGGLRPQGGGPGGGGGGGRFGQGNRPTSPFLRRQPLCV